MVKSESTKNFFLSIYNGDVIYDKFLNLRKGTV